MQYTLDFFEFNDRLLTAGAVSTPAELHGLLCGKLCGDTALNSLDWRESANRHLDCEEASQDEQIQQSLDTLLLDTEKRLQDANCDFFPFLPHEQATLMRRTRELGFWCEGFLTGLGKSAIGKNTSLSADVAEAIRSLAEISMADFEPEDNLEENEVYWTEIVEYVKVAVLLIHTELTQRPTRATSQVNAHKAGQTPHPKSFH